MFEALNLKKKMTLPSKSCGCCGGRHGYSDEVVLHDYIYMLLNSFTPREHFKLLRLVLTYCLYLTY